MLALSELIFIIAVALMTAVVAVLFLMGQRKTMQGSGPPPADPLSFLFDGGVLHHASTPALKQFALFPGTHVWEDLRQGLRARFPDLPETAGTGAAGSMTLLPQDADDHCTVEMSWRDGLCWVHLSEDAERTKTSVVSTSSPPAERRAQTMPHPAWETDAGGKVGWRNAAYDKLLHQLGLGPDAPLFPSSDPKSKQRHMLRDPAGNNHWFEITTETPPEEQNQGAAMHHATCITALVKAEDAQRTFMQTLAKTFAHLPVGLAIFDEQGQLGIFNPALVDLSGLQPSFLATRPTMMCFFDALRENRRMPEPKNYRSWRQDISQVIAAASGGQYHETWTLEDGRTYAVQGRPHPDGATAFLIEDISAEISLSRSYRAQAEQFEALLDAVEDALVVFSATGVLTFCNAAYRQMWGQNPEAAFADMTLYDAVDLWASDTQSGVAWSEFTTSAITTGSRTKKLYDLQMTDGSTVRCVVGPLAADATLIRFSVLSKQPQTADRRRPPKAPDRPDIAQMK